MKFGQAVRRILLARDPVDVVQFSELNRLLFRRKMSNEKLLRDQFVLSEMREQAFAILQTPRARAQIRKIPIKFAKHGHVIQHIAEGVDLTPKAAFRQFVSEL